MPGRTHLTACSRQLPNCWPLLLLQHVARPVLPRPLQALTKRPESRPSAAQLFQHPWVQYCYQELQQELAQPASARLAAAPASRMAGPPAAATAAPPASELLTPELRRTASQPPSPSKSLPDGVAAARGGTAGGATPSAVAAALAPFLPLSQAKMAHKVGGWVVDSEGSRRPPASLAVRDETSMQASATSPLMCRCLPDTSLPPP